MRMSLKLREIAGQAGRQNGCRLYDVYRHRDRIQVFIDKPPKGSVNLDDCQNVFHSLRFLIRSELPHLLKSHRLEVSSPGVEKRLRDKWHFEEALGEMLKITTSSPVEAKNRKTKKTFRSCLAGGQLISIKNSDLLLKSAAVEWLIPLSLIKSARIEFAEIEKPLAKTKPDPKKLNLELTAKKLTSPKKSAKPKLTPDKPANRRKSAAKAESKQPAFLLPKKRKKVNKSQKGGLKSQKKGGA